MADLRPGNPMVAGRVVILLLESIGLHSACGEMGYWVSGLMEPFAVIVYDAAGVRAFSPEGREMEVDSLMREFSDLLAKMERMFQSQEQT